MSSNDESRLEEAMRTVTPEYFGRPDREMDAIGWGVFLGMVILLVPMLPFMLIIWVIARLTSHAEQRIRD